MIMMIEQFPLWYAKKPKPGDINLWLYGKAYGRTQLNLDIKLRFFSDEKERRLLPMACQSFAGALNDRSGYALP